MATVTVPHIAGKSLTNGSAELTGAGLTNQKHVDTNGNPTTNGSALVVRTAPAGGKQMETEDLIIVTAQAEGTVEE